MYDVNAHGVDEHMIKVLFFSIIMKDYADKIRKSMLTDYDDKRPS